MHFATDKERWMWVLSNKDGCSIFLDNDYTAIRVPSGDDYDSYEFDEPVGDARGVAAMFEALGIEYEYA